MSVEVDVVPIADNNTLTAELADLIDGVAWEWSPFEEQYGFASTASTSTRRSCPRVGGTGWCAS